MLLLNGEKFWNGLNDEDDILKKAIEYVYGCLLYTSPSPRD